MTFIFKTFFFATKISTSLMENENEFEAPEFYNVNYDDEKHRETHLIESFLTMQYSRPVSEFVELPSSSSSYKTISNRTDDEEKDCSEYISAVRDWIDDMESAVQLKGRYGCWNCEENEVENYLSLPIPDTECLYKHRKTPVIKDLSLFYMILEKLQEIVKIRASFEYDTFTLISWKKISFWNCGCGCGCNRDHENGFSSTHYSNYRLEVKMKKHA